MFDGHDFQVTLTHGPENVKPQVRQTDETGSFCFEVFKSIDDKMALLFVDNTLVIYIVMLNSLL